METIPGKNGTQNQIRAKQIKSKAITDNLKCVLLIYLRGVQLE